MALSNKQYRHILDVVIFREGGMKFSDCKISCVFKGVALLKHIYGNIRNLNGCIVLLTVGHGSID